MEKHRVSCYPASAGPVKIVHISSGNICTNPSSDLGKSEETLLHKFWALEVCTTHLHTLSFDVRKTVVSIGCITFYFSTAQSNTFSSVGLTSIGFFIMSTTFFWYLALPHACPLPSILISTFIIQWFLNIRLDLSHISSVHGITLSNLVRVTSKSKFSQWSSLKTLFACLYTPV